MSFGGAIVKVLTATALAGALAFGASAGEQAKNAKPAAKKFIYLEDGTAPAPVRAATKARAPLPPLFAETSPALSLEDRLAQIKPSSLFLVEVDAVGLSAPGIHPTSAASGARARTGFQVGYPLSTSGRSGLEHSGVWLTTEVVLQAPGLGGRWQHVPVATDGGRQNYNVGLNVAYAGFSLGAALSRQDDSFNLSLQGVDLGFGYYGRSWFTNIQVGNYRGDGNPLALGLLGDRSMNVVEVGAGYKFWPGLTFSGRFKYFDYSNPLFPSPQDAGQEHVFSLDTKLNF